MQRPSVFFLLALGSWAFGKGFAEEDFVRIWPENPVVQFGSSLQINCSANTEAEAIGLESPFKREIIGIGSNWKAFRVSNIRDWKSSLLCYTKEGSGKSAKATITTYKSPDSVELDPVPQMEVGKLYNLTCRVSGVAPIRNLTITLLKGEEQLLVETFEKDKAGPLVVNHGIRAQQNDYNKTITCQTSLDLRPRGPLLKNTSHGISLWTFDFAKAPLLHAGLFLEAGTVMEVMCDAPEASPADEVMFDLWFAGEPLTYSSVNGKKVAIHHNTSRDVESLTPMFYSISVMGGLASAQAVIASSSVGDQELICKVSLGPVTKTVTKMVNVFALPKPILQIGRSEIAVGQTVNITCSADGSASPGFKMQIRNATKILASGNVDQVFLQHAVIAQQEDNGREFICQVILTVDGHTKERNISQNLTVFYGPQMDDSNCPQTLTWEEGSTTTFTCSALGNPTPIVQCWKDGKSYNTGEPQLVQTEHNGIYQCNATNQYGFDARDVTIHVEASQSIGHIIGYIIAAVVLIAIGAGIAYWVSYNQKIGIYHLWQKGKQRQSPQAAQNSVEQRFLNGKANV
ncbi:intercellular adhesion molecule 5-like isoform X1 [Crotalus tigris]|uniref:intercellular adhesion molecule 5-like isoform X1 n=1 Tax=Crotalus tigris TaxID=88082 RepID=UPI00192F73B6|nr:intercellular adhesion molecule 5-like isoform X1 [Crotalus tigris]